MSGVNKAILVGRLGQDPELKYTNNGNAVCNFSIATSEKYKTKSGEQKEETQWHKCFAWGKTGELCAEYLSKGREVYVEGKIKTRSWETDQGEKRYATEIEVGQVQFLGGKGSQGESNAPF